MNNPKQVDQSSSKNDSKSGMKKLSIQQMVHLKGGWSRPRRWS